MLRRLPFHLLTVLAIGLCLIAARWQWERAHRTEADAVPEGPVVALSDVDPATAFSGMRVQIEGTFDPEHEIRVAPRDREGAPGSWVLTPLTPLTATGSADSPDAAQPAVAVVRGWVPEGMPAAAPPAGVATVIGVLVADARTPGVAPAGDPPTIEVVDTGALATLAGYPIRTGWFALQSLAPSAAGQPLPLLVTELPGAQVGLNWRNAAYALQWVVFAGFVVFFWTRFRRDLTQDRSEHHEQELSR